MLKPDVSSSVLQNHLNFLTAANESDLLQLDGDVKSGIRYVINDDVLKGYSGMFTESVVDKIREMPEVNYVEKDQIVRISPVDL
jgi:cerevisin